MNTENHIVVSTEKKKIISTGSAFQFESEDLFFNIFSLNIRMSFVSEDLKEAQFEANYIESENEFVIKLYNYDNDLGIGLSQPIEIGEVRGKKLYFIFRVYTLSRKKNNRLVHYTFFLEK